MVLYPDVARTANRIVLARSRPRRASYLCTWRSVLEQGLAANIQLRRCLDPRTRCVLVNVIGTTVTLAVRPLTLKQANAYIAEHSRHHKPVVGHRFSIAAFDGERMVGVCVVGRPVARAVDPYRVAEVTRLATNGTRNACSILYAAAARAYDAMGFDSIQTYTLPSEQGTSLRAAGWVCEGETAGGDWNAGGARTHKGRRTDQPMEPKWRWRKMLANGRASEPSNT